MTAALRADAQRNLGRILDAAADAYAELGPDVTIDEIARRAGVGHGTVFRRFPTKDALRAAVIRARLDELLARAHELLEEPDAGAALEEFVWVVAESCRRDRTLFEGIDQCAEFAEVLHAKQELHETVDRLIRRAQRTGAVRRGLDARDVGALVGAAIQASMHAERDDAWRRYVQVVLDGLRPQRDSGRPRAGSAYSGAALGKPGVRSERPSARSVNAS
jgi:AcrR family transcriptional regulator